MAEQLSFDLPRRTARGRADFFVSPANAMAVALIDAPDGWPGARLVLTGPAGSGKTHLAHVWAGRSGARILTAAELTDKTVPELARGPVAIEDVPDIAGNGPAQAALFHLLNLVQAEGHALLLTGRKAPNLWALAPADLQSRIEAAQHARLAPPDDALLAAVLAKLFADRQIAPRPDVIPYLLRRMERSFAAAADIVERLDRLALAEGRSISRALAARVLDNRGKG